MGNKHNRQSEDRPKQKRPFTTDWVGGVIDLASVIGDKLQGPSRYAALLFLIACTAMIVGVSEVPKYAMLVVAIGIPILAITFLVVIVLISDREPPPPPPKQSISEIVREAKDSLIISGHTLDKLLRDEGAPLRAELERLQSKVKVTIILLRPQSAYANAHGPYHTLESEDSPSYGEQQVNTIEYLESLGKRKTNLTVLLSDYMPRFRAIIVDDKTCYVKLYSYGVDVNEMPQFSLPNPSVGFTAIAKSLHTLRNSHHVIPLIRDGVPNDDWDNRRAADILKRCLQRAEHSCPKKSGCPYKCEHWEFARKVILGIQNSNHTLKPIKGICGQDYRPGTFSLSKSDFHLSKKFLGLSEPLKFNDWLKAFVDFEVDRMEEMGLHRNPSIHFSRDVLQDNVRKTLEFRPNQRVPLRQEIWFQEYSDIIHRIIMSFIVDYSDSNINFYRKLTQDCNDLMLKVIEKLNGQHLSHRDWFEISIVAGILGIKGKSTHAATSLRATGAKMIPFTCDIPERDVDDEAMRIADELIKPEYRKGIEDEQIKSFFERLEPGGGGRNITLISFPDDYMETMFLLRFYKALLIKYQWLHIKMVPRSVRCSNDVSNIDVLDFLKKSEFKELNNRRFTVVNHGSKTGGVNLLKIHPDVVREIKKADFLDVRGARNYETMQRVRKEAYFGFMVTRSMSEVVTGRSCQDDPFYFRHQESGTCSFVVDR